ncbi:MULTISPECIES: Eco57I restriction-modification methylase domain-containing protein, partial [Porphyromonas]
PSGRNGFDIVIGNPPYIRLKEISVEYKRIYRKAYPYTDNQFDIFSLFIQLGSNLLCSRGINSLIIPDSFIGRSNFASLRRVLLKQTQILVWLHLDQVFDVAKVASLIFVSQKKISEQERVLPYTKATNIENWLSGKKESYELKVSSILEREDCKVIAASAVQLSLWQKLETTIKFDNIFQVWRGEELGRKSPILNSDELDSYLPILAGEDVHRYQISVPTRWIDRKLVKKSLISYSKKKILIRQLGNRINATIDLNGSIVLQSVYCLTLRTEGVDDIWFYLGLCNSKLYDYIYQITTRDKQSFQRILIENIRTLPIPSVIDPEISQKISMFAKQILQNPKELSNSQQLDQLVYELYALTDEEIRLLENDE